jgi:nucleoside-diphosphate-sugar epimerase
MGIAAMNTTRYFIVGGAGFIGSHFTDHLLGVAGTAGVTVSTTSHLDAVAWRIT